MISARQKNSTTERMTRLRQFISEMNEVDVYNSMQKRNAKVQLRNHQITRLSNKDNISTSAKKHHDELLQL